jgi:hypothetical protein
VKALMGRYDEALEQLYTLRAILESHSSSIESYRRILHADYWIWKIRSGIINAAIRQRQWRIAISEIQSMISELRKHQTGYARRPLILLLCRLSRAYLQMGNIDASIDSCEAAEVIYHSTDAADDISQQVQLARALIRFASNDVSSQRFLVVFVQLITSFNTVVSRSDGSICKATVQ